MVGPYPPGRGPSKGVPLSMPPVVPIEPYEDLGACRYGGPYTRPKPIENTEEVLIKKDKPFFERIPVEIIYEIVSNLPKSGMRNVCLCNRALNEITTPLLYKNSRISTHKTLFLWSQDGLPKDYAANVFLDPKKNKGSDKKFYEYLEKLPTGKNASLIECIEVIGIDSRTWQFGHELLRRFPGVTNMNFPWLACHREFSFRESARPSREPKDKKGIELDNEKKRTGRLIDEFGETVLKNITETSFTWASIETFKNVLEHLPKLEKFYTFAPDRVKFPREFEEKDCNQILPIIANTVGSTLVEFVLSKPPGLAHINDFIRPLGDRSKFPSLKIFDVGCIPGNLDGGTSRQERARFLWETCQASKRHGGWTFPHKHLELDILDMAQLEAEQIKTLYLWLGKNIPHWDGEFLMEEVGIWEVQEMVPELEDVLEKLGKIATVVPLKLRIDSLFPPSKRNRFLPIMKKFAARLVQFTVSPSEVEPAIDQQDDAVITSTAQVSFMEWTHFLEAILPLCKNMHTFRTVSRTGGEGADVALQGKLEFTLATLCRVHKLRHLNIDIASLLQPESLPGVILFDEEKPGDSIRVALQGIAWISTPRSVIKPDFNDCLLNLRTLTMKNLFILRQVEMVWFTNLPAKLKNLELIEIHGLVWHIGYDKSLGDLGSDDDGDKAEGEEDDEWQDSEFDEEDEIPSLKEVGEQIGKSIIVNRLDADSSLLAWLPEDSESDSDSEPEDAGGKRRLARGKVDNGGDDEDDDVHSVDSNFGGDPRFTDAVNEELRAARLKEWICRALVATAKKTGGRCRKVNITGLRIDAKGLGPWDLEDSLYGFEERGGGLGRLFI